MYDVCPLKKKPLGPGNSERNYEMRRKGVVAGIALLALCATSEAAENAWSAEKEPCGMWFVSKDGKGFETGVVVVYVHDVESFKNASKNAEANKQYVFIVAPLEKLDAKKTLVVEGKDVGRVNVVLSPDKWGDLEVFLMDDELTTAFVKGLKAGISYKINATTLAAPVSIAVPSKGFGAEYSKYMQCKAAPAPTPPMKK
jgi:invasion protein IalB